MPKKELRSQVPNFTGNTVNRSRVLYDEATMQRRFPRMLADARAYPHGYAAVHRVRWHIYRKEDAAYLPSRSTSLSQRNCPGRRGRSPASSFPREKQGKGSKERGGGRAREKEEWEKTVHYRTRKKTIYRTFNFRSPSASSIHGVYESTARA